MENPYAGKIFVTEPFCFRYRWDDPQWVNVHGAHYRFNAALDGWPINRLGDRINGRMEDPAPDPVPPEPTVLTMTAADGQTVIIRENISGTFSVVIDNPAPTVRQFVSGHNYLTMDEAAEAGLKWLLQHISDKENAHA